MSKISVDGVELTVTQIGNIVRIGKVIGRDRKRKIDIKDYRNITVDGQQDAAKLVNGLKRVAALQTECCTCGYHRGWSDHAEHCQSIYKASCEDHFYD